MLSLTGIGNPGSRSRFAQYGCFYGSCWTFIPSPQTTAAPTGHTSPSEHTDPAAAGPATHLPSGVHPADTLTGGHGWGERRRTDRLLQHLLRSSLPFHRLLLQHLERRAPAGRDPDGRPSLALRDRPAPLCRIARRIQREQLQEQLQLRGSRRALTVQTRTCNTV